MDVEAVEGMFFRVTLGLAAIGAAIVIACFGFLLYMFIVAITTPGAKPTNHLPPSASVLVEEPSR
jgi:nitrate reductase NapE component